MVSPEEIIEGSVISRQPQTRLPETLGGDGVDAVSTVCQAWFSGLWGHPIISKDAHLL